MNWERIPETNEVRLTTQLKDNFIISDILLAPCHRLKLVITGSNLCICAQDIEAEKQTIEEIILATEKTKNQIT